MFVFEFNGCSKNWDPGTHLFMMSCFYIDTDYVKCNARYIDTDYINYNARPSFLYGKGRAVWWLDFYGWIVRNTPKQWDMTEDERLGLDGYSSQCITVVLFKATLASNQVHQPTKFDMEPLVGRGALSDPIANFKWNLLAWPPCAPWGVLWRTTSNWTHPAMAWSWRLVQP